MLPTFLIIGSMKAGTTSLWEYLRHHPEVFCPRSKEIDFFIDAPRWREGPEWYESLFEGAGDAKARGEASPSYTMAPRLDGVPGRIASVVPDVRLIYLVRHPVERMRAHWAHRVAVGRERRPAEVALTDPIYLTVSRYAYQLERYFEHFPEDRILVVTSESLRDARTDVVRRVYGFVGVDPEWTSPAVASEAHRTAEKPLRAPLRAWLQKRGLLRAARAFTPARFRSWYTRTATANLPDASVSAALLSRLTDELRSDVARLREIAGPQIDRWESLRS